MRAAAILTLLLMLAGCSRPKAASPKAPVMARGREWIDLQAGWRVRVVTPLLKSGGYVVKTSDTGSRAEIDLSQTRTLDVTVKADEDFLGYEQAIYSVQARGRGVRLVLSTVEVRHDGQSTPSKVPVNPLLGMVRSMKWIRILHLVRVSRADHNAAILAARSLDGLEALTRQVQADPSSCELARESACRWVPAGIAVIPEQQVGDRWTPI